MEKPLSVNYVARCARSYITFIEGLYLISLIIFIIQIMLNIYFLILSALKIASFSYASVASFVCFFLNKVVFKGGKSRINA